MKRLLIFVLCIFLCGCGGITKYHPIQDWAKEYIESNIKPDWEYEISPYFDKEEGYYEIFVRVWEKGRRPWEYGDNFTCGDIWFSKKGSCVGELSTIGGNWKK